MGRPRVIKRYFPLEPIKLTPEDTNSAFSNVVARMSQERRSEYVRDLLEHLAELAEGTGENH